MNSAKTLCSKQFKSIFNKQLLKFDLGITGLYLHLTLKKKDISIYRFANEIYVEVIHNGQTGTWSHKDLIEMWNNKDLV